MMEAIRPALWPLTAMGEALEALARHLNRRLHEGMIPHFPTTLVGASAREMEPWVEQACRALGVESERVLSHYDGLLKMLRRVAPALLTLDIEGENHLILLVGKAGKNIRLLGPQGEKITIDPQILKIYITEKVAGGLRKRAQALIDPLGLSPTRQAQAVDGLLAEQLRNHAFDCCFMVRLPVGHAFIKRLQSRKLGRKTVLLLLSHGLQFFLSLMTWAVIGEGVLGGHLHGGWLAAWVLLLLSQIPLRLLALYLMGDITIQGGSILKSRLMKGALNLRSDEIRSRGSGKLLATVLESEALEALAINGGVAALLALVELAMGFGVLALGAGGLYQIAALALWLVVAGLLFHRYYRHRLRWTQVRMAMTDDLVERMLGHRTRLVQCPRRHWHRGEDELLAAYHYESQALDRSTVLATSFLSRGWVLWGLLALAPAFIAGQTPVAAMAIAIGGLVLTYRSLVNLGAGAVKVLGAVVSWQQMSLLFESASRDDSPNPWTASWSVKGDETPGAKLLDIRDLSMRYPGRADPILQGVDLSIFEGDRLLLQGPSGGGKSTLGALLTGLKTPSSGLILLRGFDRHSLGGSQWRSQAVSAPQFHENHVVSGSFAFNLLMGRAWPPNQQDLEEAQALCEALGLGPLLARMPSGLVQMVGEIGWQLSHGEKSRLFLARALLQDADFIVLDESFAALDPETLSACLKTVLERAKTILVIAHP